MSSPPPDRQARYRELARLRRRILELESEANWGPDDSMLRPSLVTTTWAAWEWRDLSRNEFHWSAAFFELLGYQPGELTPNLESFLSRVHPDHVEAQREGIEKALRSTEPFQSEFRMIRKSGEVIWVQVVGRTTWTEEGQPRSMSGFLRDISEEYELQARLARNERRYRTVVEAAPLGITTVDMATLCFLDPNPAMCEMLGYSAEELRERTVASLTHPEDHGSDEAAIAQRQAGNLGTVVSEKRLMHRSGRPVPVRIFTVPLDVEEGEFRTILGIVMDLTASTRAHAERAEAYQRLDLIARSSRIGMWDWSIPTGALEVDEIWADQLGYRLDELSPVAIDTFFETLHPDDLGVSQRELEKHLHGESEFYECRLRFLHKQGHWVWILARGKVVEWAADGSASRMLGTHYDISEIMEAEQRRLDLETQMLQTQKLESLGVLAGGIAHDFNNILMVIQGHVELALLESPGNGELSDSMGQIKTATDQAADLCAQMLAYSGRGSFLIGSVRIDDLVREAIPLLQSSVTRRVQLSPQCENEVQPFRGDPTQIRQVLMNLVINAAEAMEPSGGVVEILMGTRTYPVVPVRCEGDSLPPGTYTCLQVKDTGCGMDDEGRRRIFEPFYTTKFTGRGLGMSAVQGIVRAHGGGLQLESAPGQGSTFTLLFPVSESDLDGTGDSGSQRSSDFTGTGVVLAVDDEPVVLRLAHNMLERIGFEVLDAEGGQAAVELYAQHRDKIRGVFLDLTMPGMDGEETLKKLRAIDPEARVLICSGFSEKEIERRFFGKGLGGFLHKPYTMGDLRRALSKLFE